MDVRAAFATSNLAPVDRSVRVLQPQVRSRPTNRITDGRGGFRGGAALTCSLIGSLAVAAAIVAVILVVPTLPFVLAAYGFSILGFALGCTRNSGTSGANAILIAILNILGLWLAGAIVQAAAGNFVPLVRFLKMFT